MTYQDGVNCTCGPWHSILPPPPCAVHSHHNNYYHYHHCCCCHNRTHQCCGSSWCNCYGRTWTSGSTSMSITYYGDNNYTLMNSDEDEEQEGTDNE